MKLNVINNELYEYHENFIINFKDYITISYVKILDYKLYKDGPIIEEVNIEQIIEIDKYLNKEPYLSVKRSFAKNCPGAIKNILNFEHQRRGGKPLST